MELRGLECFDQVEAAGEFCEIYCTSFASVDQVSVCCVKDLEGKRGNEWKAYITTRMSSYEMFEVMIYAFIILSSERTINDTLVSGHNSETHHSENHSLDQLSKMPF